MSLSCLRSLLFAVAVQAAFIPEVLFPREAHSGHVGGVACESKECSAIGRDILARGGNAVDALVGTVFCVGVVGMYHSGIGGGGFAVVRDSKGNYEAVDFREVAPAAAFEDMYNDNVNASIFGGLASGVPGEVKGLEYMHKKWGVLPWKDVMQGAIRVARGFEVSEDLENVMQGTVVSGQTFLINDPTWAKVFAPRGRLLKKGEIIRRPTYADTLQKISEQGSKVFYTGDMAETIIDVLQANGGTMTLDDLKNYTVTTRPVQKINYRGLNLHSIGAPAGGSVGFQILNIMQGYSPAAWAADFKLSLHRFTEALRFSYGSRMKLGDPSFVDTVDPWQATMNDPAYVQSLRDRLTDDTSHAPEYYNPDDTVTADAHGTSHIVTMDHNGMAVSLTTTINLIFGSTLMEPTTGIIMNNEMNDFSIPGTPNQFGFAPSPENFIRPGKRPLSSICPIIAEFPNGTLYAAIGAAGGSRIISATSQSLWHILDHNMTAHEAIAFPRLHDQLVPDEVLVETLFDPSIGEYLTSKNHTVRFVAPGLSSVQGISRLFDGSFEAASEPRQNNSAGYTV